MIWLYKPCHFNVSDEDTLPDRVVTVLSPSQEETWDIDMTEASISRFKLKVKLKLVMKFIQ